MRPGVGRSSCASLTNSLAIMATTPAVRVPKAGADLELVEREIPERFPANDGGISLGQAAVAAARSAR